MAPAPGPARSSKVTILFVGFFAVFAIGLTTFFVIYLWPTGERVGDLDLRAPGKSITLAVQAGDTLHFRIDATVGTSAYPTGARERKYAIYDRLRASTITISDAPVGGAPVTTTCAVYDGKSTSSSGNTSEVTIGGIPITCIFATPAPGSHVITAEVAWAKDAEVRGAKLEVRRERAAK